MSAQMERLMALMERMMAAQAAPAAAPAIHVHVNLAELGFGPQKKRTDGPESNPNEIPLERQRAPYPSPS